MAVLDPMDNLIKGNITPWPPPEIVQKLYQSHQLRSFRKEDFPLLTKRLGFYCDLQSLHSEDALTWSVFGPLIYADEAVRCRFASDLLKLIRVPLSAVERTTVWLWRRLVHPDTMGPGGPEIDFGIQTEDVIVLGEAKWLSGIGGEQGKRKDKDQVVIRKEFVEKFGKAIFDVKNIVLLLVAPRVGLIPDGEVEGESCTVYFRELPWEWLLSTENHPCGGELEQYYKWKTKNSLEFEKKLWRWIEGKVDQEGEHIKISYEERPEPVALVANYRGEITVEFLSNCEREVKAAIGNELDFYFVELRERNPWAYAIYHCSTAANVYSKVHWGYFPAGKIMYRGENS